MTYKVDAKVTSKGQITVPAEIRARLNVKPGDRLQFQLDESGRVTVVPVRRRSILERLDELRLPSIGRAVTRADIRRAVGDAMREKYGRIKRRPR